MREAEDAAADAGARPQVSHALTVRQPWAYAIAAGVKDVENRTWSTSHRGWLAIHASSTLADAAEHAHCARLLAAAGLSAPATAQLATSAVVAVVFVEDVLPPNEPLASPWAQPRCFHWRLRDARPLTTPVPCAGHPQVWQLSDDLIAAIDAQL